MDPNKKSKQARELRLALVAKYYRRGFTFRQIQEAVMRDLSVSTYSLSTIKKDVDMLLNESRAARITDMDIAIQAELDRIAEQERELWEAWDKSKTDLLIKRQKQKLSSIEGGNKKESEETRIEEVNFGDARYQAEITKLGQERRKLLGLYAAVKNEITGKDGKPLEIKKTVDLSELTDEQLLAYQRLMASLKK